MPNRSTANPQERMLYFHHFNWNIKAAHTDQRNVGIMKQANMNCMSGRKRKKRNFYSNFRNVITFWIIFQFNKCIKRPFLYKWCWIARSRFWIHNLNSPKYILGSNYECRQEWKREYFYLFLIAFFSYRVFVLIKTKYKRVKIAHNDFYEIRWNLVMFLNLIL